MVPLAVLCARRPVCPLPEAGKLEELFPDGRANFDFSIPVKKVADRWSLEAPVRMASTAALHVRAELRLIPFRENAIKLCLEWMIRHQDCGRRLGRHPAALDLRR